MYNIVLILNDTRDKHKSLIQHGSPVLFIEIRHHDDVAFPVSSSSVMKISPFAVPERWRVMTDPATVAFVPCCNALNSAADLIPIDRMSLRR